MVEPTYQFNLKKEFVFETSFLGKKITVEFKNFAFQADVSLLVSYGKSSVLTTLVYEKTINKDACFLPLNVTFLERAYAFGEIPGGFFKREVKNSEFSVLLSRLTDRLLRPLFPKYFFQSVQITNIAFSASKNEGELKFCSLFGSILAVIVSDLPLRKRNFSAFVLDQDNFSSVVESLPSVFNINSGATFEITLGLDFEHNEALMLEAVCPEVKKDTFVFLLSKITTVISQLVTFQKKITSEISSFYQKNQELISSFKDFENYQTTVISKKLSSVSLAKIRDEVKFEINSNFLTSKKVKREREEWIDNFKRNYFSENIEGKLELLYSEWDLFVEEIIFKHFRKRIVSENSHFDGRKKDEVRKLKVKVDLFSSLHGVSLFQRGLTQVISVVTLASLKKKFTDETDRLTVNDTFYHHYNFLNFSTGSLKGGYSPSRREIGHAFLAKKALINLLPTNDVFPYTIRVVSDVLSSNGSTSQASICGASLSLMAAGVPLKRTVSGIALGLVNNTSSTEKSVILTDIDGWEDKYGDMDFKISQTRQGICAVQMDLKVPGIPITLLSACFERAEAANLKIISKMEEVIPFARKKINENAPKVVKMKVPVETIKNIIGSGGQTINELIKKAGSPEITIENDGQILITHKDENVVLSAQSLINKIILPLGINQTHEVFVEKLFPNFVIVVFGNKTRGFGKITFHQRKNLRVREKITVKIISIDEKGDVKVKLS